MILKICGITNQDDASAAIDSGATAIGFNFYSLSPRYIAPENAAAIDTGTSIRRVGVFVNESPERMEEIAATARLDVIQLHGEPARPGHISTRANVWQAVRVDDNFDIAAYEDLAVEALLLDGPAGVLYGGAGHTFDWRLVHETKRHIVLAGGLDATNIRVAIEMVQPWGVDACSRIESAPGKKDHFKMKEFLHAAMAAARS